MLVFDASPLIVLAKSHQLDVLDYHSTPRVVPESVHEEVVQAGLDGGHPDAQRLASAVEDGILTVEPVPETTLRTDLAENESLSQADADVIALAAAENAVAVMDEQYGRNAAEAAGVRTRGTAYLLLDPVSSGDLSKDEGRDAIDDAVDAGWYCSTQLYKEIQRRIDEF